MLGGMYGCMDRCTSTAQVTCFMFWLQAELVLACLPGPSLLGKDSRGWLPLEFPSPLDERIP